MPKTAKPQLTAKQIIKALRRTSRIKDCDIRRLARIAVLAELGGGDPLEVVQTFVYERGT